MRPRKRSLPAAVGSERAETADVAAAGDNMPDKKPSASGPATEGTSLGKWKDGTFKPVLTSWRAYTDQSQ